MQTSGAQGVCSVTKSQQKGSDHLAIWALRAMAQALSQEPALTRSTYEPQRLMGFDNWDAMEDFAFFSSNLL